MIDPGRAEARRLLDEMLETVEFQPDDQAMMDRLAGVMKYAYEGADAREWEEVSDRFRSAFGLMTDDQVVDAVETAPPVEGDNGSMARSVVRVAPHQRGHEIDEAARVSKGFDKLVPDGFMREYLDWTREQESPSQFHFGAAITIMAAGLGRRPLIEWGARPIFPNLFALLVGPTGARKGAAIDRALQLVGEGTGANILPNEGTHQGFAAALRARGEVTMGASSDGLIVAPEFSVLMSKDSNKGDLTKWLTDWYDSPPTWSRALRGEPDYELLNVCVSVLGGSNIEWLRTMPPDAITGGFMPRFLLFHTPEKRHSNYDPQFPADIERSMQTHLGGVMSRVPEMIRFNANAKEYMKQWYEVELDREYRESSDEQYRAWLARKQAAVMKLAVVWQLIDGGGTEEVGEKWITQARAVVDWCDTGVGSVYGALGVSQEGMVAEDVRKVLEKAGGKLSKRGVVRELSKRYTESRIDAALRTLRAAGDVRNEVNALEGTVWRLK